VANLRDSEEIIELRQKITTFLKREANANRDNTDSRGKRVNRNDRSGSSNANGNSNSTPCRKHEGAHLWKGCPENWRNKNSGNDNSKNSNQAANANSQSPNTRKGTQGEVKSTENQRSTNGSPMVRFDNDCETDDESACSSHASRGELMEIVGSMSISSRSQNLHPITIITLLDSNQKRLAWKTIARPMLHRQGSHLLGHGENVARPHNLWRLQSVCHSQRYILIKRNAKTGKCHATLSLHQQDFHH
jgi:hypothetical protein